MQELEHDVPVSFYFKVWFFNGLLNASFKEVSGLTIERELETIQEGGVNNYEHKVPKQTRHGNLVLKRALMPILGAIELWIKSCIEGNLSETVKTCDIYIWLLNPDGIMMRGWCCTNAYPIKWEVDNFDSEKNGIAIETIEMNYNELIRIL